MQPIPRPLRAHYDYLHRTVVRKGIRRELTGHQTEPGPSVDGLQFFARLEAHRFSGRNVDLGSGTRIASDAGLARPHVEHAKAAQFDAVAMRERLLHALKDGFHRLLRLGLGNARLGYNFIDNVEL